MRLFFPLFLLLLFPLAGQNGKAADPLNAAVKIHIVRTEPNYSIPWQNRPQISASGSGAVIAGNRILTNAHNAANTTFLAVSRQDDTTPVPARVLAIDHQCDLALLEVEDKNFFRGIRPFEIGETPPVRSQVYAVGYPMGGEGLSVTKGIISRIEPVPYAHSMVNTLLAAQLDAAVNPGNSGGPVLFRGKIAGIAFQGNRRGKSLGYMIHTEVIRHFLKDFQDGRIDGFPDVPMEYQSLDNHAMRKALKLPAGRSGMLITRVHPFLKADPVICKGDVLVSVDGKSIDNNGRFSGPDGELLPFGVLIDRRQVGETVPMTLFRDGKEYRTVVTPENCNFRKIRHPEFDVKPDYFICGGCVFMPLSLNLLKEFGDSLPPSVQSVFWDEKVRPEDEITVLTIVLGDRINTGYQDLFGEVVTEVNGKPVSRLGDLIREADGTRSGWLTIRMKSGKQIVFPADKLKEANGRILRKNGIHSDRGGRYETSIR